MTGKYANRRVRIIGGKWGRHKITFALDPRIRPSADAVRETLFNWLAGDIENRKCLDLFAGSGVLGIEALSRGSSHITFIDISYKILDSIKTNLELLSKSSARGHDLNDSDSVEQHTECPINYTLKKQDALKFLKTTNDKFDLVFLDAPFNTNLLQQSLDILVQYEILSDDALIYLEYSKKYSIHIPTSLKQHKHSQQGSVIYGLYRKI